MAEPIDMLSTVERLRSSAKSRSFHPERMIEWCAADLIEQIAAALLDTSVSLAAAISLLEMSPKTAAPSNKMFDQMLKDYRTSLEHGRTVYNQMNRNG